MTAHLGLVLWATGRWAEAKVAAAALREGRGGVTTRITGLYVRGYVALGRGRLGEARTCCDESLALGERSGDILRRLAAAVGPRREASSPAGSRTRSS